jgi:large subunit ribosomal protein L25
MEMTLTAETGRPTGSRPARRIRAEGRVPAVVYGLGRDPRAVTVEWPDLRKVLTTEAGVNALISLSVDGETHLSIVKDLQRHPVRRTVAHVDFQLIDPDTALSIEVPVVLVGTATHVEQEKGIVDQLRHSLTVWAKPGNIPNSLEVDISELEINDTLKVSDIPLPEGVTTDVDAEDPVAVGSITRSALAAEDEGEGEGVEGEGEGAEAESGEAEAE